MQTPPPPVGSVSSFHVRSSFSTATWATVGARLMYSGANVLLYIDTLAPANGFTPSAALLKAMAINSADNGLTGYTVPDNNVGWGRIDADNVLYFTGDAKKLLLFLQRECFKPYAKKRGKIPA